MRLYNNLVDFINSKKNNSTKGLISLFLVVATTILLPISVNVISNIIYDDKITDPKTEQILPEIEFRNIVEKDFAILKVRIKDSEVFSELDHMLKYEKLDSSSIQKASDQFRSIQTYLDNNRHTIANYKDLRCLLILRKYQFYEKIDLYQEALKWLEIFLANNHSIYFEAERQVLKVKIPLENLKKSNPNNEDIQLIESSLEDLQEKNRNLLLKNESSESGIDQTMDFAYEYVPDSHNQDISFCLPDIDYNSEDHIDYNGFVLIGEDQKIGYKTNRVVLDQGFKVSAGTSFKVNYGGCDRNGKNHSLDKQLNCNNSQKELFCHIDDWAALKAVYLSTDGDNWFSNSGWEEIAGNAPTAKCDLENLFGVNLNEDGCVEFLNLFENQLRGKIPSELYKLNNLKGLLLNGNNLLSQILPELGDLSNLKYFYLNNNQLSGKIPFELANLSNLTHMYLNHNQLSGSISPDLGSLSNLGNMEFKNNELNDSYDSILMSLCFQFTNQNFKMDNESKRRCKNKEVIDSCDCDRGLYLIDRGIIPYLDNYGNRTGSSDISSLNNYFNNADNTGKTYALLLGINDYKNIKDLNYSINDINLLKETLENNYSATQNKLDLTILKDKEATKQNILLTLNDIKEKVKPNDNILMYFVGHGFSKIDKTVNRNIITSQLANNSTSQYILPYDFSYQEISSDLCIDEINEIFNDVNTLNPPLFIVDACRTIGGMENIELNEKEQVSNLTDNTLALEKRTFIDDWRANYVVHGTKDNWSTDAGTCAQTNVYSGDLNQDEIVNNQDFVFSKSRALVHQKIEWYGYPCEDWQNNLPCNGANIKHLDCNGDGIISIADSDVVIDNLGLTHNECSQQIVSITFECDYSTFLQPVDELGNSKLFEVSEVFPAFIMQPKLLVSTQNNEFRNLNSLRMLPPNGKNISGQIPDYPKEKLNKNTAKSIKPKLIILNATSVGNQSVGLREFDHGLFTYNLVKSLKKKSGVDLNKDNYISLQESQTDIDNGVQKTKNKRGDINQQSDLYFYK